MFIRQETPDDAAAVYAVHSAAFARPDLPAGKAPPEAGLVDELRRDGDVVPGLSLVAVVDGAVVGHVVCSRGRVEPTSYDVVGLGPLGVLPAHQRSGAGKALMHGVLAAADALGQAAVVLLGDPAYYGRFGFEPAIPLGVRPPAGEWGHYFQLRRLAAWPPDLRGDFHYAPAFGRL